MFQIRPKQMVTTTTTFTPVSYTHLDVYKRQGFGCYTFFCAIESLSGFVIFFSMGFPWVYLVVLPSYNFVSSKFFLFGFSKLLLFSHVRWFVRGIFLSYSYPTWVLSLLYFGFLWFIFLYTFLLHCGSLLLLFPFMVVFYFDIYMF